MLSKTILFTALVTLFVTSDAFRIRNCTEIDLDDGETVEDCNGEEIKLKNKDGKIEEVIVFSNETFDVIQYPDSEDCYVALKEVQFPEGVEYAQASKDEKAEEADDELANQIRALAPNRCTGKIFSLSDLSETEHEAARKKRACISYIRCTYYLYRGYYYGRYRYYYYTRCRYVLRCYY